MKVGIMQPYFWPYLGYFQLIKAVDAFVVYDDIKYTKKGWINRNRILLNGAPETISLPLAVASDDLDIRDRRLAANFPAERARLVRRLEAAYHKAPYRDEAMAVVRCCLECPETNLFGFLLHSIEVVMRHLGITTPLRVSSTLGVAKGLRGQERVIATCQAIQATEYLNPPGGRALYDAAAFAQAGLRLRFLEPQLASYPQFGAPFVSHLSIVDLLMFNSQTQLKDQLNSYRLDTPGAPSSTTNLSVFEATPELQGEVDLEYLSKGEPGGARIEAILNRIGSSYIPALSVLVDVAQYARKLDTNAETVMARSGGKDIGIICVYANRPNSQRAFISTLGVDVSFLGKGIGQRLMDAGFEIARRNGCTLVELRVSPRNQRALAFYIKNGFAVHTTEEASDNHLTMQRKL